MTIVHLSTNDIQGGAARAAYRLHLGLLRHDLDSSMFVANRYSSDPAVKVLIPPMDIPRRLRRILRWMGITLNFERYRTSRPGGYDSFSDDRSEHGPDIWRQSPPCDLINLHWVAGFVDYKHFFSAVPERIPIVYTLHDMNPFTGGCHYDHGCGKFREQCGACPQLGSHKSGDLSRRIWKRKRESFEQIEPGRFHVVSSSRWLASEAARSTLMGRFPVSIIPYALDTDDFAPYDRSVARAALKVPEDAHIVLFVADVLGNRRKGFELLDRALSRLGNPSSLILLSLGSGKPALRSKVRYLHLGYIADDRLLSLVYSAADVFVIPSLQEAFGQTALESMACGTPVVGFDVGGIPDFVRSGVTGLLVPPGDVDALASAINGLLEDSAMQEEMSSYCRRIVAEEYSLEVQAKRYIEVYRNMLDQRKSE